MDLNDSLVKSASNQQNRNIPQRIYCVHSLPLFMVKHPEPSIQTREHQIGTPGSQIYITSLPFLAE